MELQRRKQIRIALERLRQPLAITAQRVRAAALYVRDDGEAVTGRGLVKDRAVLPLLEMIGRLRDRDGLRFDVHRTPLCPVPGIADANGGGGAADGHDGT